MSRRYGYLTAGGRPGDLLKAFWTPRSHYKYIETTAPQTKSTFANLRSWCPEAEIFIYVDVVYPGWRGQFNVTPWPISMEWRPTEDHPGWIKDGITGKRVNRFNSGMWMPKTGINDPLYRSFDPIRVVSSNIAAFADEYNVSVRCDNLAPTIGWDFTDSKTKVKSKTLIWYGKTYFPEEISAIYTNYARRANISLSLAINAVGSRFVPSSSIRWDKDVAEYNGGRLQEYLVDWNPMAFGGEPFNTPEGYPLLCCFPKTVDRLLTIYANPRLQPNVVLIEMHDLGGRVLGG